MTRTTFLIAAVLALGVAAGTAWLLGPAHRPFAASSRLEPDDAAVVGLGKALYAEHCAACHGANLEGQPQWRRRRADGRLPAPPHDASGHTWHHDDELLIELTRYGPRTVAGDDYVSDMPAYDGVLDAAQIVAVLSYIKSTWPPDVRRQHDAINRRAIR